MEKQKDIPVAFRDEEINWEELAGIGILRDELEASGELDTLLRGEKTGVLPLSRHRHGRYAAVRSSGQ